MRYYCHQCRTQHDEEDLLPDFKCPNCESGFVEEVEQPSQIQTLQDVLNDFVTGVSFGTHFPGDISSSSSSSGHTTNPQSGSGTVYPNPTDRLMNIDFPLPFFLNSDIGDYAWGNAGFDAVITQLLNNLDGSNSGPPPMPKDQVDDLPTVKISDEHVNSNNSQCTVCMEDFQLNDLARRLPCDHFFHQDCIIPWLNLHASCPICRKTFSTQNQTNPGTSNQTSNSENTSSTIFLASRNSDGAGSRTDSSTGATSSSNTNVNLKEEDCD